MSAYRTVLVGTDGSETAARAVARAVALAQACEATLVVATVNDPERGALVLTETAAAIGDLAIPMQMQVLAGDPADALVTFAADVGADVLVVGNKGMHGAARFLLGSVPNRISHRAGCDVLIVATVRPKDAE